MAQPNVAREPSMEEILASIRRIIESNEPGAGRMISGSLPPVYGGEDINADEEIHLTIDNDNVMDAPFDPVKIPNERPPAVAGPVDPVKMLEETKALSLADVAARVRAASERNTAQLQQRDRPSGEAVTPVERPSAENLAAVSRPVELRRPQVAAVPAPGANAAAAPMGDPAPAPVSIGSKVTPLHAAQPSVGTVAAVQALKQPEGPVAGQRDEAPAARDVLERTVELRPAARLPEDNSAKGLLSPSAGDQVSRSFSDLEVMVDRGPRRSFDEIAEEMMRPMLQEWLDDNLPTLVERLVREEIERVARGPRR